MEEEENEEVAEEGSVAGAGAMSASTTCLANNTLDNEGSLSRDDWYLVI